MHRTTVSQRNQTLRHCEAIILFFFMALCVPCLAFGMTPVAEQELSEVTGAAGVNINADLRMNITMGTMAWGDATGIDTGFSSYGWATTDTGAGWVGASGFDIRNLRIKARETDTYGGYTTAMLKPITIDVASDPSYVTYNGATFVRIGLGSLQVSLDEMVMNVGLGNAGNNLNQILGSVSLGGMNMYINPTSYVDIYNAKPGAQVAVFFTFNMLVDRFDMDYMSWGDMDGAPDNVGSGGIPWYTGSTAGYIGLDNLVVDGPIRVAGTVIIDIGSSNTGVYAAKNGGARTTVVHIIFQRPFTISAGTITADVKLDGQPSLSSANAGLMGSIYMAGVSMTVQQGSWVDIWAH